ASTEVDFESAPRKEMVTIRVPGCLSIFLCDFEYTSPIARIDVGRRVLICDRDPEHAMTCRDIKDLADFTALAKFDSHDLSGLAHHRHHALSELHPVRIFWFDHALFQCGATSAHGLSQVRVTVTQARREQEIGRGAHISRRMTIQK